jgi:chorismate mutase/prephenate dehydratase
MNSLSAIRKKIDQIDSQIIQALNKRANLVLKIAKFKKRAKRDFFVPVREKEIYEKIKKEKGVFPLEGLKAVYREIISSSLALQAPLKIAYFSGPGSYTHQASLRQFGSNVEYISCEKVKEVFEAVIKGKANYGIVPIENSTEGTVRETLDTFLESHLMICAEIEMPIHHCLLSKAKSLDKIKIVYGHIQAISQTKNWLYKNLPKAEIEAVAHTSLGAEIVKKKKTAGLIGGKMAAEIYHLNILAENIEDLSRNITKFIVVGKNYSPASGNDKTAIVFSVKDRPGVLRDALSCFADRGINLTKIESRPSRGKPWDYIFFIDFIGHPEEKRVKQALEELEKICTSVKILGAWPI